MTKINVKIGVPALFKLEDLKVGTFFVYDDDVWCIVSGMPVNSEKGGVSAIRLAECVVTKLGGGLRVPVYREITISGEEHD